MIEHSAEKRGHWAHRNMVQMLKSYWLRYTACFLVFLCLLYVPLFLVGRTIIWSVDGLEMTYPFFAYEGRWLRGIIAGLFQGSFEVPLWDTSIGMGSDILLTIGTNPFNYLSVLFPERYAELGVAVVVVLELYLAGLAFSYYAFQHGKDEFQALAGSMMYVFCCWAIASVLRQHTFVVPLTLFPLLLAGADKVFKRQSPLMFVVAVALFFWTYFYLAYMACIMLFFYCVYCFIRYEPHRTVLTFALWVVRICALIVLGALIAGIAMLPTVMNVLDQGRLSVSREIPVLYTLSYYARTILGFVSFSSVGMDAFIGFGALGFFACVLLFLQPGRHALKVGFIGATVALCLPYFGHALNGFSYVTNRWAWAYAFLVAFVFAEMVPGLMKASSKECLKLGIATFCYGVVVAAFPNTRSLTGLTGLALMIVIVAILSIRAARARRGSPIARAGSMPRVAMMSLLAISLLVPTLFWYTNLGEGWAGREIRTGSAYDLHWNAATELLESVDDKGLWRYDQYDVQVPRNNAMLQQLNSYDYYTPLYNEDLDRFLGDLNLGTMRFSHFIMGDYFSFLDRRSFVDAVLGAKYYLTRNDMTDYLPFGYSRTAVASSSQSDEGCSVFASETSLPMGFFSDRLIGADYYEGLSAVQKQQAICQAIVVDDCSYGTCVEDAIAFTDASVPFEVRPLSSGVVVEDGRVVTTEAGGKIGLSFDAPAHAETYVLFDTLDYRNNEPTLGERASIDEILSYARALYDWTALTETTITTQASNGLETYFLFLTPNHHMYTGKNSVLVNLGYNEDAVTGAEITLSDSGVYSFENLDVISQPMDNLLPGVESLKSQEVTLSEGVNSFTASVSAERAGVLCLMVPWSNGWSASVDGEKADVVKANEAFLGVALDQGDHEVVFEYRSPWVFEGSIMSVVGVLCLVCLMLGRRIASRAAFHPKHGAR